MTEQPKSGIIRMFSWRKCIAEYFWYHVIFYLERQFDANLFDTPTLNALICFKRGIECVNQSLCMYVWKTALTALWMIALTACFYFSRILFKFVLSSAKHQIHRSPVSTEHAQKQESIVFHGRKSLLSWCFFCSAW